MNTITEAARGLRVRGEYDVVVCGGGLGGAAAATAAARAGAKVLLIECTFFEDDHKERARHGKHLHVQDLPGILEGMENERIILIHVTRRTHLGFARKQLKRLLDKSIMERVSFLMDQKHMED